MPGSCDIMDGTCDFCVLGQRLAPGHSASPQVALRNKIDFFTVAQRPTGGKMEPDESGQRGREMSQVAYMWRVQRAGVTLRPRRISSASVCKPVHLPAHAIEPQTGIPAHCFCQCGWMELSGNFQTNSGASYLSSAPGSF
ncbi:uncharacterized protein LOC143437671 [Arvicanthis niloticus]|uniref:uncharacterized protein LOC143310538 n=1 Tax=Arvicanthis niloticus TaxID=61156 RepID=UPI00402BACDD